MFDLLWKKAILRKFARLQKEILTRQKKTSLLTDEELQKKAAILREKIRKSKDLDKYLVPVFTLVREVIHRKIGLLLFPTQVFGGIVLHYGNIAQMNTGEGKTLTALLPVCLNALSGKPVYVITVNEYLANRDWNLGKPIFDFFGITSGFNSNSHSSEEKKELYANSTVIYTIGSELGFDYLRNNLITRIEDKNNLRFTYALLDEVDSILIDESQNPLIISQRWGGDELAIKEKHQKSTYLAQQLVEKVDYKVDDKEKELWLTAKGIKRAETFYGIDDLFSFKHHETNFLLHNSLKAKHFYQNGVEYIVDYERKKIVIIDSLTGRLVPNRVYSSGIQQAVESKEGIPISPPSKSSAVITYQNFFRLFDKVAGMTGTAMTEAEEFRQVYGMEVIAIRPYKKLIRKDRDDLIFLDKKSKYQAIIQRIKKNEQTKKRPILVGSPSVDVSEYISTLLAKESIFHHKLNAVNHREEAQIIKRAGELGAVTISTNMAGRGTDIILTEESRKVGGLLVIGVERNFSRRIDNQLRGRAGRQGDSGESQFYVSLEDELIKNYQVREQITRIFQGNSLRELFRKPLSGKWFNMMVAEPQEMLRNAHASGRQYTLNYDLLINHQRKTIYSYRQKVLTSPNIFAMILRQKLTTNQSGSQQYLKSQLVREIDFSWANYLESLEKVRFLVHVRQWLPQDPPEAFFWETSGLFRITCRHIRKKMRQILLNSLPKSPTN
ncbi:preprotein translocase subunit SecA [endosymbiont GvMRE of Glomus versiforme]|uniref:preprotein translocase subunit SecA n=1 Tax=endosymbiont GvMRE of Glomus versiforme TaxID=2039283 RepID=UPI000EEAB692|nr:preprotein translocase subunit SecA [endosymbiont GvMRE of Glomus versiforme]RHZ37345.1 Protein translocase subunit SecA [endosymbiont GvMRE of Glomus versiforme]